MMKNKKITIEDLARMVKKGFDETAKKEQVINLEKWAKRRFDNIDRELEARVKDLEDLLAITPKK